MRFFLEENDARFFSLSTTQVLYERWLSADLLEVKITPRTPVSLVRALMRHLGFLIVVTALCAGGGLVTRAQAQTQCDGRLATHSKQTTKWRSCYFCRSHFGPRTSAPRGKARAEYAAGMGNARGRLRRWGSRAERGGRVGGAIL